MVDEGTSSAIMSNPIPGSEELSSVFHMIWLNLRDTCLRTMKNSNNNKLYFKNPENNVLEIEGDLDTFLKKKIAAETLKTVEIVMKDSTVIPKEFNSYIK